MDRKTLPQDVLRFRHVVFALQDRLPALSGFPKGRCRDASEVLAACLVERGHGQFRLICGFRYDGDHHETHAWLQGEDGLIIDVTWDQFTGEVGPALLTSDPKWYEQTFEDHEEQALNTGALHGNECEDIQSAVDIILHVMSENAHQASIPVR